MDDLTSKITQILNDPDGMDMVKNIASSLMNNDEKISDKANDSGIDIGNALNLLSGFSESDKSGGLSDLPISPAQIATITKAMGMMKNNDDDRVKLLYALKPHLSEERQKKCDNAIKMLKMVKLLPLIKDSGLFDMF